MLYKRLISLKKISFTDSGPHHWPEKSIEGGGSMPKVLKNSRWSWKKVTTFGENIHLEKFQPYVLSHRIIREGRKTDYLTGTERNIILAGRLWEELLWLLWSPPTPFKHSFNLLKVLDLKAILPISSSTHRLLSSFKIQKSRAALKVLVRDLSSKGQRKLWKLILYKSHQLA